MTSLKAMTQGRELKVGSFIVEFATPGIGYILKNAGCDFVLFDCEHSGFGFETVKSALRWFEAANLAAIVRVPSQAYNHLARAADMGAEGIMVPMVGSAEDARAIVAATKYVPEGSRGVALGIAHDKYGSGPVEAALAAANQRMSLFLQIETRAGVENCEAIAATPGVDCLWVGHFDLSCSLGVPGQFASRTFKDAIDRVTAACRQHGKSLGRLVPDVATGVALAGAGHDFICYSGDVWLLGAAIRDGVTAIRDGAAASPARSQAAAPRRTAETEEMGAEPRSAGRRKAPVARAKAPPETPPPTSKPARRGTKRG